jgi:hypothetical protein
MQYDIKKRRAEAKKRYEQRLQQVSPEKAKKLKQDYKKFIQVLDLLSHRTAPEVANMTGMHRTTVHDWGTRKFPQSFELRTETDLNHVTERQKELHKIYASQACFSTDTQKLQMDRDLADIDQAAELLMKKYSYREAYKIMGSRFRKANEWIKKDTLPLSFRDSATRTKEIPAGLTKKKQFAYLLGVYQSKVGEIHNERLTIVTQDSDLEKTVKQSLNALRLKYSQATVHYASRSAEKTYCDSKNLMNLIKEATEDNTSIPKEFMQDQNLLINYLQGFFDSRATPSYAPRTIQNSKIRRISPRITITKSGNASLLSAINTALHSLGINSRYNPRKAQGFIVITETESIKKVMDYKLFRNREKMQTLKTAYNYWKETQTYDSNGKFQKLKEKILEERRNKK